MSALGLGMEHSLRDGPLPRQLLACVRLIVATEEEIAAVTAGTRDPRLGPITLQCEEHAIDTLLEVLQVLVEPVESGIARLKEGSDDGAAAAASSERNENGLDADWVVSLGFCRMYLDGQRRVLVRAIRECEEARHALSL